MSYIIRCSLRNSCFHRLFHAGGHSFTRLSLPVICTQSLTQSRNYIGRKTQLNQPNPPKYEICNLEADERRTNRIKLYKLKAVLEDIERENVLTSSDALKMIHFCGKLLCTENVNDRMEILDKILKCIDNFGTKLDVSHYNALLNVYLENNHNFSPDDFLADMEKRGIEPNRITYQRLMRQYCLKGDVDNASRILEIMRKKSVQISISVFNSLIIGHSNNNDMESAENILEVLKTAHMHPNTETYAYLVGGYVKQGNFEKAREMLKEAEVSSIILCYDDYFYIIEAFLRNGYEKEIDEILKLIKRTTAYNIDASNFCVKLLMQHKPEAAFKVLKTIRRRNLPDGTLLPLGDDFVAYMVKYNLPVDSVIKYCVALMEENLNPNALLIAMEKSLRMGKQDVALSLFTAAMKKNIRIRHHYFWPLLVKHGKENNCLGIIDVLNIMNQKFGLVPNTEMIREYVVPIFLKNNFKIEEMIFSLKSFNVSISACVSSTVFIYLMENRMKEAADVAEKYNSVYIYYLLSKPLTNSFIQTRDFVSYVRILKEVGCGFDWFQTSRSVADIDDMPDFMPLDYREVIGRLLTHTVSNMIRSKLDIHEPIKNILLKMIDYQIGIDRKSAQMLKKLPEFSKELVDLLEKLLSKEFSTPPQKMRGSNVTLSKLDVKTLEQLKESMKARNENVLPLQKYLLTAYTRQKDEKKVLELLEELKGDDFVSSSTVYLKLFSMYADLGKLDEMLKVYETLLEKVPMFKFDSTKLLKMANLLVNDNQTDKALEMMKLHVSRNTGPEELNTRRYVQNTLCRKMLETIAEKGDVERVNEFCDFFLTNDLADANSIVLGPTIQVHIVKGDLDAAVNEVEKCVQKYKQVPYQSGLTKALIVKEDVVLLQRLVDLTRVVHGPENSLHNLMLDFLECGFLDQARKLLKLPDFQLNTTKILNACNRFYQEGSIAKIRDLLELVKETDFPECAAIYYFLLCAYDKNADVENALALWTEIQNDLKVQPTDEFLVTLASLLRRNNRPVPFDVPVLDETVPRTLGRDFGKVKVGSTSMKLRSFLTRGKVKEALELKNSHSPGTFTRADWSSLIESCLQEDLYEDAKTLLNEYVQNTGELPLYNVTKFLVKVAMKAGDISFLEDLASKISLDEKKRISFDNHLCRAYLVANRAQEYLWNLEQRLQAVINSDPEFKEYLDNFPRGGILSIMRQRPEYAAQAEKLLLNILERSNDRTIANILWVHYMLEKNYKQAEEIWVTKLRDSKISVSFRKILTVMEIQSDVELGLKLLDFVENQRTTTVRSKGLIYGSLINTLTQNNDLDEALRVLKRAEEHVGIGNVLRRAVTTLEAACLAKNIDFPFKVPTEENGSEMSYMYEQIDEELFA